jgi:hypothetical protein
LKLAFPQPQDSLVLRDIHMPLAPSWWPLAPGWWVLFALAGLVVIATWLLSRNARRKRHIRRRILAEIDQVAARHPQDDAAYAASLHQLLRRAARRYATDAHSSQGERWKQVLARVPVDTATLDRLMTIDACMYRPDANFDRPGVEAAVRRWLEASLRRAGDSEARHA